MADRTQVLLHTLDRDAHRGIEIGPWFAPVAPKRDGWRVDVIDAFDSETLRERARGHSESSIRDQEHMIEDVDAIWRGEPLDELAGLDKSRPYDFVIGSHTLEHIPDLLGFLRGVSGILRPAGVLSLAVPDSRFCFDAMRWPSSTAEVLTAFRERRKRHVPETLFAQVANGVHADGGGAWLKGSADIVNPMSPTSWAVDQYRSYERIYADDPSHYVDCHAWVFTPASAQLLLFDLGLLGMTDLVVKTVNTRTQSSEFYLQLEKTLGSQAYETNLDHERLRLVSSMRKEVSEVVYRLEPLAH